MKCRNCRIDIKCFEWNNYFPTEAHHEIKISHNPETKFLGSVENPVESSDVWPLTMKKKFHH